MQSLEIEQGIEVIGIIISTFSSNPPTSYLLKQSIKYAQLEVNIDKLLFLIDYTKYGFFTTEGWISAVWKFCSYYELELYLPSLCHPFTPILNDKPISQLLIKSKAFNQKSKR